MIQALFMLCNLLGFSVPVYYFWITGHNMASIFLAALSVFWVLASSRGWSWVKSLALLGIIAANSVSFWLKFPPIFLVISTILIILAWDLDNFTDFIKQAEPADPIKGSLRGHLVYLAFFFIVSTPLSILTLVIKFQTSFIIAVLLAILTIVGLLLLSPWFQRRI